MPLKCRQRSDIFLLAGYFLLIISLCVIGDIWRGIRVPLKSVEQGCPRQMPGAAYYSDLSVKICLAVMKSKVIIKLLGNETPGAVLVIIRIIWYLNRPDSYLHQCCSYLHQCCIVHICEYLGQCFVVHKNYLFRCIMNIFNGFYTPTKTCAFSQHFIIFLLHCQLFNGNHIKMCLVVLYLA